MKITLILAAADTDPLRKNDPFMPLSLPLIAAAAPEHDYTFVDMLGGQKVPFDRPADLVGISARITAEKTAFAIADRFREKGVKVVLGGAQISVNPHGAAAHADAVAVGEAEGIWPTLLRDAAVGTLRKFYIAGARPFDTGGADSFVAETLPDLTAVSGALETRRLYKKKYRFDSVYASRGCALGCDFCSVGGLFGRRTRLREIDRVVEEIATFRHYYYLLDDTVFGRPHTYDYYARLYDRIGALDKVRYWTGQANLDAASHPRGREVIRKAADAGLLYAAVGMESIQPAVLAKAGTLSKNGAASPAEALDRMRESIRFIQDQGIMLSGWFTIGYEEDTVETFRETLAFCDEMDIIPIICPLEALPGTPLYDRLRGEGRISADKRVNIVHPTMTDGDILEALATCYAEGFTVSRNLKRTRWFRERLRGLDHCNNVDMHALIEKTIFVFVLQMKLKKGIVGLINSGAAP